ncbi:MAG: hypothetical protein ACRDIB_05700 [Ardenticatenaceae bacterium]
MPQPALAVTIADPHGDLVGKLADLISRIGERFSVLSVAATNSTDERVFDLLRSAGARITTAKPNADAIGRHRREAVALALKSGSASHVFYADLDHVLRWIENDAEELDAVIRRIQGADCTVVGRGPRSMAALPRRLAETERIVNEIFALTSGLYWDVMMATRGLSRRAAKTIVTDCSVDTIGNDCAWPLFCAERGFSLDYVEAEGLTYRTNSDYAHDLSDSLDHDPRAWAMRVRLAAQHVEAMLPYMRKDI